MLLLKNLEINKKTNNKQEIKLSLKENSLKIFLSILINALNTLKSFIKVSFLKKSALINVLNTLKSFKNLKRKAIGKELLNKQALLKLL